MSCGCCLVSSCGNCGWTEVDRELGKSVSLTTMLKRRESGMT